MKFVVNSMSCNHCVNAITKALSKADANAQIEIDLATKTVQLQTNLAKDAVLEVLSDAGYEDAQYID